MMQRPRFATGRIVVRSTTSPVPQIPSPEQWSVLFGPALSSAACEQLQAAQLLRTHSAGQPVFARDQRARDLVAVLEGSVGLGQRREDGSFDLQRSVTGPQWLDLSSAWLGGGHGQDAMTLSRARIVELPVHCVRELLIDQPELGEMLLAGLARTVRSLARMSYDLVHKDAGHRLAEWLLRRCPAESATGSANDELIVPLVERKRDVAAQLGITPETFSRNLRALSTRKLIEVSGYSIKVLNLPALRALAQGAD